MGRDHGQGEKGDVHPREAERAGRGTSGHEIIQAGSQGSDDPRSGDLSWW